MKGENKNGTKSASGGGNCNNSSRRYDSFGLSDKHRKSQESLERQGHWSGAKSLLKRKCFPGMTIKTGEWTTPSQSKHRMHPLLSLVALKRLTSYIARSYRPGPWHCYLSGFGRTVRFSACKDVGKPSWTASGRNGENCNNNLPVFVASELREEK